MDKDSFLIVCLSPIHLFTHCTLTTESSAKSKVPTDFKIIAPQSVLYSLTKLPREVTSLNFLSLCEALTV